MRFPIFLFFFQGPDGETGGPGVPGAAGQPV